VELEEQIIGSVLILGVFLFHLYLIIEIDIRANKYGRSQVFWMTFTLFFGLVAALLFLFVSAEDEPQIESVSDRT